MTTVYVFVWRNVIDVCMANNWPAFELLQLTVVQHTSHVLIHLLKIKIENKSFLDIHEKAAVNNSVFSL